MTTITEADLIRACFRQCPKCGYVGEIDTFDVLGADEGKLFCPQCMAHRKMKCVDEPGEYLERRPR